MTAHDIQQDAIYAKGYAAAERRWKKKYEKLLSASEQWFHIHNQAHGEPDESDEYFELKKILDKERNL